MKLAAESVVTIYGDTLAFLLLLGLLLMASAFRGRKDNKSNGLFSLLCVLTMVNSLSNALSYAFHHQTFACAAILRRLTPSIAEFSTLAVLFIWLVYIDYKLYESWDRTRMVEKIFRIPIIVILVLFIVNIFSGIMFEVEADFTFTSKPLFMAVTVIQYLYGILPVVAYVRYVINHGFKHFFHISPIVIPSLAASVFTLCTPYSARSFGFAIAIVFLYFSYMNRWRFDDDETGFYNRNYIDHIKALARDKKVDYKSALFFELDAMPYELCRTIKDEIPKGGEVIRIEDDQLLVLSESANTSMLVMLSDLVIDDAEEYDNKHPDRPIDLSSFYVIRKKNESAEDFIRRLNGEIA